MRHGRREAFTLIEITVVILMMAIVAGAVTLRAAGTMHRATLTETVDRLGGFDRLTRVMARSQDRPLVTVVDMGQGTLSRLDRDGVTAVGSELELPSGLKITEVRTDDGRRQWGRAEVPCSCRGLSPTWALCLEDDRSTRRWVLLAGLTGQMIEVDSDATLDALYKTLSPQGRGAGR